MISQVFLAHQNSWYVGDIWIGEVRNDCSNDDINIDSSLYQGISHICNSVNLGNAWVHGYYTRSAPFFLISRKVQLPAIRWFQNSILLSLRFFPRFSISSAKRSRRRGQGDWLRSTYWHSDWLHFTNSSFFDWIPEEGLFLKAITTTSDTTVQK